jgi:hypothetical protein
MDRSQPGSALLFIITALATGWQVWRLIMWGVWGRPSHPLETVALVGAGFLFLGGLAAFGSGPAGAVLAIPGCLLLGAFYVPAVWQTLASVLVGETRFEPLAFLLAFLPPGLLVATSIRVVRIFAAARRDPPEPSTTD